MDQGLVRMFSVPNLYFPSKERLPSHRNALATVPTFHAVVNLDTQAATAEVFLLSPQDKGTGASYSHLHLEANY